MMDSDYFYLYFGVLTSRKSVAATSHFKEELVAPAFVMQLFVGMKFKT